MKFVSKLLGDDKGTASAPEVRGLRTPIRPGNSPGAAAGTATHELTDEDVQIATHCGVDLESEAYASAGTSSPADEADDAAGGQGEFVHATYSSTDGRRDYRLYVPIGYSNSDRAMPLIVMLHGCAHTPENFAVGTRMNMLADQHGFLVAYPRQTVHENRAKCWNWYRPQHQQADAGEPSILAGITRQIATEFRVDTQRIFVAGLSAGASMAVILGRAYPTLFRAIGVHSGTPYSSAHGVPSALATLNGKGFHSKEDDARNGAPAIPMIVFHGDRDHVVAPINADALLRDAMREDLVTRTEQGRVPDGHAYTREVFADASGRARLERWTVHGSGHAWSGGAKEGMYTEPQGPDASTEMLRFFLRDVAGGSGASVLR